MSKAAKIKTAQAIMAQLTAADFVRDVTNIISEIKAGKWNDSEVALLRPTGNVTVGELRLIPNFEQEETIIRELVGALIGRQTRAVIIEIGLDPSGLSLSDMAKLFGVCVRAEEAAIRQILKKTQH